jgi:hypothetical protein
VADATLQILGLGTSAVPLDYMVPGGPSLALIAVKADFDGTSSGVDFVPMVEIISPAGDVMAFGKGEKVLAGGSVTQTFAPFLRGAATQTAGGGIKFDTYPQLGDWLYVETNNAAGSPNGYGTEIYDSSAGGDGIRIHSDNGDLQFFCGGTANFSGVAVTISSGVGGTIVAGSVLTLSTSSTVKMVQQAGGGLGGQEFSIDVTGGIHRVKSSNGQAVFEVHADGSLHGQTGKSLVFDL